MSPADKFDATLLADSFSINQSVSGERQKTIREPVERLSVELDFGRVSQSSGTDSTHPHVLFSPLHYEAGYAYPLIVWLHGSGNDERQVMRIMPVLSMRNYVAVAPRGIPAMEISRENPKTDKSKEEWSLDVVSILKAGRSKTVYDWLHHEEGVSEAERRVFDCISLAKQRCNIASRRVFLAGFGSGGTMALRLALLNPESFAGVASLGGPLPTGKHVLHRWTAARNLAVFLGTGESSLACPPESLCRSLELFHTAGVRTAVREYPCGQELAPAMLQDVNRWMMDIVCS